MWHVPGPNVIDQTELPLLRSRATRLPPLVVTITRSLVPLGVATALAMTGAPSAVDGNEICHFCLSWFTLASVSEVSSVLLLRCCASPPNCSQGVTQLVSSRAPVTARIST